MRLQKHVRFDWAIKRLLRQKANFSILEGFLSELLKDDITIVEIIETESNQETETDKFNRVDILVKDKKGELIIIEIQNSYAIDYFLRILFGISKAITEHIKVGDEWTEVKKVISINIVYFDLGRGEDYIYKGETRFFGVHQRDELQLSSAQQKLFKKEKIKDLYPEIYLLKVNNFNDVAKDTLDEWIYFLKNSEIKKTFTARGLKEAEEVLKIANMEDNERREYQRFGEVLSDRASQALSIRIQIETAIEKQRKETEEQRQKAEEQRQLTEEQRQKAEEQRQLAEEQSQIAEEHRKEAEEKRKEAEEHRKEAEEHRKEAEERRKEAEAHRKEAEEQRKEAEARRKEVEEERKKTEAAQERAVKALILGTELSDQAIADTLGLEVERVTAIRNSLNQQ